MINAKEELLNFVSKSDGGKNKVVKIKCVEINFPSRELNIFLKVGYSISEFENFMSKLDIMYDNGYGGQELYGTVWLDNNTWLTRGEYDGSEWWKHHKLPQIPRYLK